MSEKVNEFALRGHVTAAPLKPAAGRTADAGREALRGHVTAAPLKRLDVQGRLGGNELTPRSRDRGPIEAHQTCEHCAGEYVHSAVT